MRHILALVLAWCVCLSPVMAVTADQIVQHFEDSQKWVKSAMVSFSLHKTASDSRISDLFEFVSDKVYEYQGLIINGDVYQSGNNGPMAGLMQTIGKGVFGVLHKLTTDDHKTLFKPTWIGYHTPDDKRVSNWFCLIMGDHIKTYLTRVDQRSKLDEVGTDPLGVNVLNKNLFKFDLVKDLGTKAILRITPKEKGNTNVEEAIVELESLKIGNAETWYATKIQTKQSTGATSVTQYGKFRVAVATVGTPIVYSEDDSIRGDVKIVGLENASSLTAQGDQKLYVFATQIQTTTEQKSKEHGAYTVDLVTTVKRLFINPSCDTMLQRIEPARLATMEKICKKIVANH